MRIKHSKFQNTGLLYEVLNTKLVNEIMEGKDSKIPTIIKRHFNKNSELLKELKVYKAFNDIKDENDIDKLISLTERINNKKLKSERYNLVKEIKALYDIDSLFKTKINEYKKLAAISNLIEANTTSKFIDPQFIMENKKTLINEIKTSKNKTSIKEETKEFFKLPKDERILVFERMIKIFNKKYGKTLNENQQQILSLWINNSDNKTLVKGLNESYKQAKKLLSELIVEVKDTPSRLKLKEFIKLIPTEIKENKRINEECISKNIKTWELINEIKQF